MDEQTDRLMEEWATDEKWFDQPVLYLSGRIL